MIYNRAFYHKILKKEKNIHIMKKNIKKKLNLVKINKVRIN